MPNVNIWLIFLASAFLTFVVCTLVYLRYAKVLKKQKLEKFNQFKNAGFKSTQKMQISGQLFAIDENSRQWFIMDYANPSKCVLHSFSSIQSFKRQESSERHTSGRRSRIIKGFSVSSYRSRKVYTRLGVSVSLNDLSCPTEFISCLGEENRVDTILSMLEIMKSKG